MIFFVQFVVGYLHVMMFVIVLIKKSSTTHWQKYILLIDARSMTLCIAVSHKKLQVVINFAHKKTSVYKTLKKKHQIKLHKQSSCNGFAWLDGLARIANKSKQVVAGCKTIFKILQDSRSPIMFYISHKMNILLKYYPTHMYHSCLCFTLRIPITW